MLDNDALLNIFYFYQPAPSLSSENERDAIISLGGGNWNLEHWWYSLAQVCHRWRCVVFESAFFLGASLVCTYGTPLADILAYLPPPFTSSSTTMTYMMASPQTMSWE